ncbi:hypothetical protein B0H14DRAFT_2627379 [Mycena olivaceomarginata]|nr:hypothetical protein B0H14DRAFT_2627379 [Mycena olivaceomarginata]
MDILTLTLVLCLLATNLNRLLASRTAIDSVFRRTGAFDRTGASGPQLSPPKSAPLEIRVDNIRPRRSHFLWPSPFYLPTLVPAVQNRTAHKSIPQSPFFWDFWPDGELKIFVTNNLATNWVLKTTRSNGSTRAPIWDKGHETRKQLRAIVPEFYCYSNHGEWSPQFRDGITNRNQGTPGSDIDSDAISHVSGDRDNSESNDYGGIADVDFESLEERELQEDPLAAESELDELDD